LKHLLPIFVETCAAVIAKMPERMPEKPFEKIPEELPIKIIVPTLPHLKNAVIQAFEKTGIAPIVITDKSDKYAAFMASTVALAASGTVALELGIARLPTVIGYKMNILTAYLAKTFVKLESVSLINILLKEEIMPEFLQERCTSKNMAPIIEALLFDESLRQKQINSFDKAIEKLKGDDPKTPSQRAAEIVFMYC
jgi:lipid-A-disaccharide synthase